MQWNTSQKCMHFVEISIFLSIMHPILIYKILFIDYSSGSTIKVFNSFPEVLYIFLFSLAILDRQLLEVGQCSEVIINNGLPVNAYPL